MKIGGKDAIIEAATGLIAFSGIDRLTMQTLSEELGISRMPVNAALARLQNDGYVTILPQSGTYVRELSEEELPFLLGGMSLYSLPDPTECILHHRVALTGSQVPA